MGRKTSWDLFISHASEDKSDFVKPLVKSLEDVGVKVWYDEFSLKLGDSLSRSIDRGLSSSKYGIVVISKAFIAKRWPEYELQSLVTLERSGRRKRIIPIRHGVSQKEVMKFSPFLADKIAGDTSRLSLPEITIKIIEVVRPDIFEDQQRLIALQKMYSEVKTMEVPLSSLISIRGFMHEKLPKYLLTRISVINSVFQEVYQISLEETFDNFRKDLNPESEIMVWESMAAVYLRITTGNELSLKQKREIFGALLFGNVEKLPIENSKKFDYVTPQMLADAWNSVNPDSLTER